MCHIHKRIFIIVVIIIIFQNKNKYKNLQNKINTKKFTKKIKTKYIRKMVCNISCAISAMFIISSIYMSNATNSSEVIKKYKEQLSDKLKIVYEKITEERKKMRIQYIA